MDDAPAVETRTLELQDPPKGLLRSAWRSVCASVRATTANVSIHRRERRLRLCETLSLGEKRIVALVQFDDRRFLIAATAQNISLLPLDSAGPKQEHPAAP